MRFKPLIFTTIFVIVIFFLNYNHQIQQGTYRDIFIPLAENLISNNSYTHNLYAGEPATYPLWGFVYQILPGLAMGIPDLGVLIANFILALIGIYYFYKLFDIPPKNWHNLIFLPFYAIMSTKTPDTTAAALFIPAIYYAKEFLAKNKVSYAVYSGFFFGIILNFRSEYLLFPIFLFFFSLVFHRSEIKNILKFSIISLIISLILILPWGIRNYSATGKFSLSATNGGTVAYISLGQLPNNDWGIIPIDQTAYNLARENGINNPYSFEGDSLLKKEFLNAIKSEPIEYSKKVIYNFFSAFIGGVYTGEYSGLFINKERMLEIGLETEAQGGAINKIKYVLNLPFKESISILSEKIIRAIFIPIFLLMIIIFIFKRNKQPEFSYLNLLIFTAVIYKFLLISFLQYEYRHLNQIYLLLAGSFIIYIAKLLPEKKR